MPVFKITAYALHTNFRIQFSCNSTEPHLVCEKLLFSFNLVIFLYSYILISIFWFFSLFFFNDFPGYAVAEGTPVRERRLPCCGIGLGWFL